MELREFGFLQKPLKGKFLGISFAPLDEHAERLEALKKDSNVDGFYYPPQIAKYTVDPFTNNTKEKIEQTNRPASVYFLPSSHTIIVNFSPIFVQTIFISPIVLPVKACL